MPPLPLWVIAGGLAPPGAGNGAALDQPGAGAGATLGGAGPLPPPHTVSWTDGGPGAGGPGAGAGAVPFLHALAPGAGAGAMPGSSNLWHRFSSILVVSEGYVVQTSQCFLMSSYSMALQPKS